MSKISERVEELLGRHNKLLIPILQDIQKQYSYLPENFLKEVAKQLNTPLIDIFGVATFYKSFSLEPKGNHVVSVCMGTACHVRGGPAVLEEFERQLGISEGQKTSDNEFSLETVACMGACALGPIVVTDGEYHSHVKPTEVKKLITNTKKGIHKEIDIKKDKKIFPIGVRCPRCNHTLMDSDYLIDGYPSIFLTVSFDRKIGWYRLSSLYGSFNSHSEHGIPKDTKLNIFCPHCHEELTGGSDCPECGTIMVPMIVKGGGTVQICPRRGCKGHMLDV